MARLATKTETGIAAEILGRAFVRDPVLTRFFRNASPQAARLAQYFELECRLVLKGYGEVWLDDDQLGAAIWRRPGGYPERLRHSLPLVPRYIRLFPRELVRASRAMNTLWREHPRAPHWYLFAVGVVPEATGQGAARRSWSRCCSGATRSGYWPTSRPRARTMRASTSASVSSREARSRSSTAPPACARCGATRGS